MEEVKPRRSNKAGPNLCEEANLASSKLRPIVSQRINPKAYLHITPNHSLSIFFLPLPNCILDEITNAIIPIQILRLLCRWQQGTCHGRPTIRNWHLLLDIPTLLLHHSLQCIQRLVILIFHLLAPEAHSSSLPPSYSNINKVCCVKRVLNFKVVFHFWLLGK